VRRVTGTYILVHDVLLDVVHNFRVLLAQWPALLLTIKVSLRALKDLAEQAEVLSMLSSNTTVAGQPHPSSATRGRSGCCCRGTDSPGDHQDFSNPMIA
jgi:hypothetical protein